MAGQSADQQVDLLVDLPATLRERSERQAGAQILRAPRRARAEHSQSD